MSADVAATRVPWSRPARTGSRPGLRRAYWQMLVPLQVAVLQEEPAQHVLPLAPQTMHRLVAGWKTNGSPQYPPEPRFGAQQGSPSPPHATHVPLAHVLEGEVQPTPLAQQAW